MSLHGVFPDLQCRLAVHPVRRLNITLPVVILPQCSERSWYSPGQRLFSLKASSCVLPLTDLTVWMWVRIIVEHFSFAKESRLCISISTWNKNKTNKQTKEKQKMRWCLCPAQRVLGFLKSSAAEGMLKSLITNISMLLDINVRKLMVLDTYGILLITGPLNFKCYNLKPTHCYLCCLDIFFQDHIIS